MKYSNYFVNIILISTILASSRSLGATINSSAQSKALDLSLLNSILNQNVNNSILQNGLNLLNNLISPTTTTTKPMSSSSASSAKTTTAQNILSNLLNNPNLLQEGLNLLNIFISTSAPTKPAVPGSSGTESVSTFLNSWASANLNFLIQQMNLPEAETQLIMYLVPQLLNSQSMDQVMAIVEPFLISELASFLNDPAVLTAPNPILEAFSQLLKMYFASPDAPAFLQDNSTQQMILMYLQNTFGNNNASQALVVMATDLLNYLNLASVQEILQIIRILSPDLYTIVQDQTDLMTIVQISISYVSTFLIGYYNNIMGLLSSQFQMPPQIPQIPQSKLISLLIKK